MAAGNFLNNNATNIFAVEIQEEWDYEDLVTNLQCELKAKVEKSKILELFSEEDEWENLNRNFCGKIVAEVESYDKIYKDFNCSIKVKAIIRNGYYSGVNLDWEVIKVVDGEIYDIDEDIFFGYSKEEKYYSKLVTNYFEKNISKVAEEVEEVFKSLSIPLTVTARFSSGETMYAKVS